MISLLVTLIIIGAVLYVVQLLPIDATVKRIAYVLVIVFVVVWLLNSYGHLAHLG